MKSVKSYVMDDMWGHIIMSGPDIRGYILGEAHQTPQEQYKYCQGIFTVYPHMMLGNFTRWLWEGAPPKEYGAFMEVSVQGLQSKVLPALEICFDGSKTEEARGEVIVPLLTDVIPKYVLTGFYDYMFAGQTDYKDIADFWPTVEPLLALTARMLRLSYAGNMPTEERAELFLFVGTRMPYLLLKRWYDWQFGAEKMEMPPPPPEKLQKTEK